MVDVAPIDVRLRFASRPTLLAPSEADPLYLVPHGTFTLHPSGGEPAPALMCGLGAAEYVGLAQTQLRFVAGGPAYAPNFDPAATTGPAAPGPRLVGPVSTAWAALTAPDPLVYFAQPEGAALFGSGTPAPAAGAARTGPLPFFEIPAATLPRRDDPAAGTTYPLVPMAGLTGDLEAAARLEVQVLSQQRREVVHGLALGSTAAPGPRPAAAQAFAPADAGTDPLTAATPQGLLATFSADRTRWDCLKIAQSTLVQADGTVESTLLALQDVVDPLKAALLTNQQFLVVSDASALASQMRGHSQIVVANYRFQLDPGPVGSFARHDHARQELRQDAPGADRRHEHVGARPAQFNVLTSPSSPGPRLQDDRRRGALASTDPLMAPFQAALVATPRWNGVLFLSATRLSGSKP